MTSRVEGAPVGGTTSEEGAATTTTCDDEGCGGGASVSDSATTEEWTGGREATSSGDGITCEEATAVGMTTLEEVASGGEKSISNGGDKPTSAVVDSGAFCTVVGKITVGLGGFAWECSILVGGVSPLVSVSSPKVPPNSGDTGTVRTVAIR